MKTIYIDGYFFNHETLGGISRMWLELIKNITMLSEDIQFIVDIKNGTKNIFLKTLKELISNKDSQLIFIINEEDGFFSRSKIVREIGFINAWQNRRKVVDCNYDVDIFHSSYMSTIWPKRRKIPAIVTVHDLIIQKFKSLFANSFKGSIRYYQQLITENFAIKNADHLIAVSQSSKNDLVDYFGFREDMISIIHHGISDHWFSCSDKVENNSEPYFLFVGGRNPYKNYDTVLKALAKLDGKYKDIQLITVGENFNSREKEQQRYRELKISRRVQDIGIVSDKKLKELYSNAIALIFPSVYEGFGFPLLESLACGCPVIASDIPTNREIGESYVHFFSVYNASELSEQLINIYNKPPDLKQKQSYVAYSRTFTWERAARKLAELYQTILL